MTLNETLKQLKALGNEATRKHNAKWGAGDNQFGGLVHFYVSNVDECHRKFVDGGVPIAEPPSNSLGPDARDMLVIDPDGNRLSFITLSNTNGKR